MPASRAFLASSMVSRFRAAVLWEARLEAAPEESQGRGDFERLAARRRVALRERERVEPLAVEAVGLVAAEEGNAAEVTAAAASPAAVQWPPEMVAARERAEAMTNGRPAAEA